MCGIAIADLYFDKRSTEFPIKNKLVETADENLEADDLPQAKKKCFSKTELQDVITAPVADPTGTYFIIFQHVLSNSHQPRAKIGLALEGISMRTAKAKTSTVADARTSIRQTTSLEKPTSWLTATDAATGRIYFYNKSVIYFFFPSHESAYVYYI